MWWDLQIGVRTGRAIPGNPSPRAGKGTTVAGWVRLCASALVLGAALLGEPAAHAHHAFAATYLLDRTVRVEGNIVEFLFRNPHSVVLVKAQGENGQPIVWAADWGGGGQLSRQGIELNTLKAGDRVIVTGNPSRRAADCRMRLQGLVRPADGWKWSATQD